MKKIGNIDEHFTKDEAVKMAWELFNQTGSVGHYLLYKRLKDKE